MTDEILAKKLTATDLGLSGTLTTPDQFGAFTLNLTAPFGVANKLSRCSSWAISLTLPT